MESEINAKNTRQNTQKNHEKNKIYNKDALLSLTKATFVFIIKTIKYTHEFTNAVYNKKRTILQNAEVEF